MTGSPGELSGSDGRPREGNEYESQACNGADFEKSNSELTVPVGSLSGCQSAVDGYAGVFDLCGNVEEWEDSCQPDQNTSFPKGYLDYCRVSGGGRFDSGLYKPNLNEYAKLACIPGAGLELGVGRNGVASTRGFRCCSP